MRGKGRETVHSGRGRGVCVRGSGRMSCRLRQLLVSSLASGSPGLAATATVAGGT